MVHSSWEPGSGLPWRPGHAMTSLPGDVATTAGLRKGNAVTILRPRPLHTTAPCAGTTCTTAMQRRPAGTSRLLKPAPTSSRPEAASLRQPAPDDGWSAVCCQAAPASSNNSLSGPACAPADLFLCSRHCPASDPTPPPAIPHSPHCLAIAMLSLCTPALRPRCSILTDPTPPSLPILRQLTPSRHACSCANSAP